MRDPQSEGKRYRIGNERITNSSPLLQFLTAELLQQHRISDSLNCKYQNFIQHIAEDKAHGTGAIIDDVQRHIENHLGYDIDNSQVTQYFLLPVTKEQYNGTLCMEARHYVC